MMPRAIGIDLGTTFSAAAAVTANGTPQLLWNRDGETLTPSVVLYADDGTAMAGSMALRSLTVLPDDCVQFVKRQMGNPHWSFADSRGVVHRPEQISSVLLKRLVEDASTALDGAEISGAVITVPAYFDDARRKATQDAAQIADLNVLRLINEPTAAAIAYGVDRQGDAGTLFVFDLGGGTFDVTVLRFGGGQFDVIATDGDRNLGGFDFDNALMTHVAQEVLAQGGPDLLDDGAMSADLRDKCELAKKTLSQVSQASIMLAAAGRTFTVKITRTDYEQLTADLLRRTEDLSRAVLDEAGLTWQQIDKVLLAGGSTRMPMVRDLIVRLSGRAPETGVNPDEVVALGAALIADQISARTQRASAVPVTISDVTSQSLGTIALNTNLNRLVNDVLISRNSKIPSQVVRLYGTVTDYQEYIAFVVTEGDDEDPDYVTRLLERPIELPRGLLAEAPIQVTMAYDADGVVHVDLFDVTNNRPLGEIELDRPHNLGRSEVDTMRAAMADLEVQ